MHGMKSKEEVGRRWWSELGKMRPPLGLPSVRGLWVSKGGIQGSGTRAPRVKSKALSRKEHGSHQHVRRKMSSWWGRVSTARGSPKGREAPERESWGHPQW